MTRTVTAVQVERGAATTGGATVTERWVVDGCFGAVLLGAAGVVGAAAELDGGADVDDAGTVGAVLVAVDRSEPALRDVQAAASGTISATVSKARRCCARITGRSAGRWRKGGC
jgi:hypothetical protein